ncbi:MAG TPA: hypothetical protein VEC14_07415 [Reyranellaceae bacterium]|nr:hypothetical protein [Reyranellaceae bacterium]
MTNDMTVIVGVIASLICLVLAWRAYRGAAADDKERKRKTERRDPP